ncbi:MAG: Capsule assembly protein Wzi [Bacteroidetes bacterium HLUCCA01]|nr:MAG: Capsule assembly protein Wzi [Bacteroidetes bacterium HLUCCA01]
MAFPLKITLKAREDVVKAYEWYGNQIEIVHYFPFFMPAFHNFRRWMCFAAMPALVGLWFSGEVLAQSRASVVSTDSRTPSAPMLWSFTGAPMPLTRVFVIHPEQQLHRHRSNARELGHLLLPEPLRASLHRQTLGRLGLTRADQPWQGSRYWLREFARPEVYLLPFTSVTQYNNDRVWSPNNGPAWSGRGVAQAATGGFSLRWLIFDVQLAPVWVTAENRDFATARDLLPQPARGAWISTHGSFDAPVRIDSAAVNRWYWGETWAKLMLGPLSAGVSNQNLWWGPGRRHSIFMSNNAPGFNHLTLHTNRPLQTGIGGLQFQYIAGRLERSYYNEASYSDDWRYLTALVVDFEPRFAPGLHVGLIRAFHIRARDLDSRSDYFPLFQPFQKSKLEPGDSGLGDGSAPDDQRASVYFSWHFPVSEVTFYGEFGRTDHATDIRDFYLEPNHARAYLLGMHKVFRPAVDPGSAWSLSAEIMDASNTMPSRVRLWVRGQSPADLGFYSHGVGGLAHLGRGLGSFVGLAGTSWFASVQRSGEVWQAGFMGEFTRKNRVTYLRLVEGDYPDARQELEMTAGGYASRSFWGRQLEFQAGVWLVKARNQHYIRLATDAATGEPIEAGDGSLVVDELRYRNPLNVHLRLTLRYRLFPGIVTR